MQRSLLVAAAALLVAFAGPTAALAQISSADQYVEDVPTSTGGAQGSSGGGGGGGGDDDAAPLSPAAEQALDESGGADANALRHVATSPTLGAPSQTLAGAGTPRDQNREVSVASALSQGIGALAGVDARGSSTALLAALAIVTAAIAAFAVRRSRRGRTS
jgi:hypothetical protein